MKSLHLCNVANVAYGYCKILNQIDHQAELRCHDLLHLMSQPEWDDLELNSADFPDENDFTVNSADFGDYQRPSWYQNAPVCPKAITLPEIADKILPVTVNNKTTKLAVRRAESLRRRLIHSLKTAVPANLKEHVRPTYHKALSMTMRLLGRAPISPMFQSPQLTFPVVKERIQVLVKESQRYEPEWHLTKEMLTLYRAHAHWLDRHLTDHDVTMAYVYTPIYAMIQGKTPYVSVEIGTMRDLPFDGTPIGKMLALAYRLSDQVIITNPDVIAQANKLGLERYQFCPHPVDEEVFKPAAIDSPLRLELQAKYDAEHVLIAPARQNWAVKGNDRLFRAFAELTGRGVRAVLVIPGWGQEIARSKELCQSLNISHRVAWIAPVSEPVLLKYFQAADLVLDQFILGVFGLVTCKALSCGKTVLTSYDRKTHAWCFAEHPPLVDCRSEKEIMDAMFGLLQAPNRIAEIGQDARRWVEAHHSKREVQRILLEVMKKAIDHAAQSRQITGNQGPHLKSA
ncbi:MAG TPA: glycosyltransferase [Gemmataceae bacterium]|nr:glycosyltransferase [Gemmataceae bacterium]